jgi:transcriptional regulator with XRE-family HTH domain
MRTPAFRLQVLDVVGVVVQTARLSAGWSQRELSRRSGVPQAQICRIERGRVPDLRITDLDQLLVALGVRYWLGTEVPHTATRQSDLVHARCSAYVGRRLGGSGWLVEREVEIGSDRSRAWIDILAYHPERRILLVIELKTEIHDFGAIERSMNWYQREAVRAAERFGWRPRTVGSALLILQSVTNDDRVVSSGAAFATGFPGRGPELQAMIDGGVPIPDRRFMAMIDPRSRRAGWLRSTRSDGRRSIAPYVDYIDAARLFQPRSPARPRS